MINKKLVDEIQKTINRHPFFAYLPLFERVFLSIFTWAVQTPHFHSDWKQCLELKLGVIIGRITVRDLFQALNYLGYICLSKEKYHLRKYPLTKKGLDLLVQVSTMGKSGETPEGLSSELAIVQISSHKSVVIKHLDELKGSSKEDYNKQWITFKEKILN